MAKAMKMFLQKRKTDITKQRFKIIEVYWSVLTRAHCISLHLISAFQDNEKLPRLVKKRVWWNRWPDNMDRSGSETSCAQVSSGSLGSGSAGSGSLGVLYSRFGNFTSCKIIQDHTRSCKTRICQFLHCLCSIFLWCRSLCFTDFHWALHWPRQNAKIRSVGALHALHGLRRNFGQNGFGNFGKGMERVWKWMEKLENVSGWVLMFAMFAASCCFKMSGQELNGAEWSWSW